MGFKQTWRWYGPHDTVSLWDVKQAGAKGIVTALHHIPVGETWPLSEITKRQQEIAHSGLIWEVVESVNVHEAIKMGSDQRDRYIDNYAQTLRNLGACNIKVVCYNFMPVLDWTRTDLYYQVSDGSKALRYNAVALAAFDLFLLNRPEAVEEYGEQMRNEARKYFDHLDEKGKDELQNNILAGLPGTTEVIPIEIFKKYLFQYQNINKSKLKQNLKYFLEKIIPVAEQGGINMCIHPDDPPYPIFGLPRIISNAGDLEFLLSAVDSPHNGITFCSGSLGPNKLNDLPAMVRQFGHRIHFVHLRNIQRQNNGSFYESDHLDGSVDMYQLVRALVLEMNTRRQQNRKDHAIPMRPDHGHQMLDDLKKHIPFPGYSAIGRLRGLAELRGLELGIEKGLNK